MVFTPEDKLRYEIEKLELEIKDKRRSSIHQPAFWIPILTVIISLSGNIFQWANSKNEKTLADIQVAQARLEGEKAEAQLKSLQQNIGQAQMTYVSVNQQISDAENRLKEITEKIKQTASPQLAEVVADFKQSLADIRQINEETAQGLKAAETSIPQRFRNNLQVASAREREGFEKLIAGDYNGAAQAFKAAENAYPSYHQVYELERLIRSRRSDLADSTRRKEVFQLIVNKYNYGAPVDLLDKIKNMSR